MLTSLVSGRVGGDATAERVNNQFAIKFSVAHSFHYKNEKGEKVENTTWVKCTIWREKDNLSQHIKKGMVVMCMGVPKAHAWVDNDKKVRSQLEMTVNSLEFVLAAPKPAENTNAAPPAPVPPISNESWNS